jgi:hypothetical protein
VQRHKLHLSYSFKSHTLEIRQGILAKLRLNSGSAVVPKDRRFTMAGRRQSESHRHADEGLSAGGGGRAEEGGGVH